MFFSKNKDEFSMQRLLVLICMFTTSAFAFGLNLPFLLQFINRLHCGIVEIEDYPTMNGIILGITILILNISAMFLISEIKKYIKGEKSEYEN